MKNPPSEQLRDDLSTIVAITGIGVRAPGSGSRDQFWDLLRHGRTATRPITLFDTTGFRSRIGGECDFNAAEEGLSVRERRRMDRATQLAVVCAGEAWTDAGLDTEEPDPVRVSVTIGSAVAAATSLEQEYLVMSDGGRSWEVSEDYLSPHMFDYLCPAALPAEVAWRVKAQGQVNLISDGCTSGLDAVSTGVDLIRRGRADIVVAGATDAPLTPIVAACFDAIRATSPLNESPETASRPFDMTRAGFVLAEGAAMLVLEPFTQALARGAHVYACIGGHATQLNAHHMTGLRSDGVEMAEAIKLSLQRAHVPLGRVDYINAHGSGTTQNDRHETAAFKKVFGDGAYEIPISSIKSMVGHSLGAIGAVELAASALAIDRGFIPPTANLNQSDPDCDLDYVPLVGRSATLRNVISVGSGFGGFQSCVVLQSLEEVS